MKQIIHILSKDLRHYAWAWITLLACAVIEIYLLGTTAGFLENTTNEALSMLVSVIRGILFFIIIVMVVQEETLVDPSAYWLSRPIGRGRLLVSKLLFVLILIGIFQIADVTTLLMNGGSDRIIYALFEILIMLAIWQAQIFLAAQTRNLPHYLLLTVSIYVGIFVFIGTIAYVVSIIISSELNFNWGLLPATISEHWLILIQTLFWLSVGLALLFFVYLKRRIFIAWLLLIPAICVSILLTPNDNFIGVFEEREQLNTAQTLQLNHLLKGSYSEIDGDTFTEVIAVFAVNEAYAKNNLWAIVYASKIQINGKEFELETHHDIKRFKRFEHETGNLYSISLGHAKISDLKGDESNVSVFGFLQLRCTVQTKVGTMNLQEGETYSKGGNRLVIQSITRNDNELELSLNGYVPRYSLEPRLLSAYEDRFDANFSFGLARNDQKNVIDFNLSYNIDSSVNICKAKIKTPFKNEASLKDYCLNVYMRKISNSERVNLKQSAVSFQNKPEE